MNPHAQTDGALLALLTARARENLKASSGSGDAAAFLAANGLQGPRLAEALSRYGAGWAGPEVLAGLDDRQLGRLRELGLLKANRISPLSASGLLIPTYDPSNAEHPASIVKICPGQAKHSFILPPLGLGMARGASDARRAVLADNPLLLMRLAALGVRNLFLAESPEVLPPLLPWLKARDVVLATYRRPSLEVFQSALSGLAVKARAAILHANIPRTRPETLELLGIDPDAAREPQQTQPLATPPMLPPEPGAPALASDAAAILPGGFDGAPELIAHDAKREEATFRAGDALYRVEVPLDDAAKVEIRLERGGKAAIDRFDLSVEAQRRRFARSAALRTAVPFEAIEEHLLAIIEALRALRIPASDDARPAWPAPAPSGPEREAALAFLRRPDLLDSIAADLEALGWVGEGKAKRLLYLAAVSRKLASPLSVALRAPSGSGKSHGIEAVSALMPPEDVVHVSRLTESALYYQQDALRHRLLVLDEADAMTPEVMVALRVLQSRGALSQGMTIRDGPGGQASARFAEAQGPVAVLTSTTRELDAEFLARCYDLGADDSPEQTARILSAQRLRRAEPAREASRAKIAARHHALQRVLETRPVVIPFAGRIEFPASSVRHRREQERFLNLLCASALLHQFQRMRDGEAIVASEADFEVALDLASEHVARAGDELTRGARDVLALVHGAGLSIFGMRDLKRLRPDWSRHRFLCALDELMRLQLLSSPRCQRGKPREYILNPEGLADREAPPVRLAPGLSALSGEASTDSSPRLATG